MSDYKTPLSMIKLKSKSISPDITPFSHDKNKTPFNSKELDSLEQEKNIQENLPLFLELKAKEEFEGKNRSTKELKKNIEDESDMRKIARKKSKIDRQNKTQGSNFEQLNKNYREDNEEAAINLLNIFYSLKEGNHNKLEKAFVEFDTWINTTKGNLDNETDFVCKKKDGSHISIKQLKYISEFMSYIAGYFLQCNKQNLSKKNFTQKKFIMCNNMYNKISRYVEYFEKHGIICFRGNKTHRNIMKIPHFLSKAKSVDSNYSLKNKKYAFRKNARSIGGTRKKRS